MKTLCVLMSLFLMSINSQCQSLSSDSLEIFRLNDHYIEIKSLRVILSKSWPLDTPYFGIATHNFMPDPPAMKEGVALIKDRQGRLLSVYIYEDSAIVNEDHYVNGKLERQEFRKHKGSLTFDKYYWPNGNLQYLIFAKNYIETVYEFDEDGNLLIPKD